MTDFGHVKMSRKAYAQDPFWTEDRVFSKWEAWEWMIQAAAWKDHKRVVGMTLVEIKRGEFLGSVRFLAEAWGWKRSRVHEFVKLLLETQRIAGQRETHAGTVYMLVNYDAYQSTPDAGRTPSRTDNGQEADSERTASGQREGSKAGKEGKEDEALDGQIVKLRADDEPELVADQIIMAANRGMNDNPTIVAVSPIYTGHGSRQAVIDWLADGIGWEVARDVCYRVAKEFKADGRRKQIGSMGYFDGAVRAAWDLHRANNTEVRDEPGRPAVAGAPAEVRRVPPSSGSKFAHRVERAS